MRAEGEFEGGSKSQGRENRPPMFPHLPTYDHDHCTYIIAMICFRNALIWAMIGGSFEIVKLIVDQQNVLLFEKDVDGKYILY